MATVTVEGNGRPYAVGCADGQEERVRILARQFDSHVRQIAGDVGHVGDLRLFLMASLMLADELHEARQRLENGEGPAAQNGPIAARSAVSRPISATVRAVGSAETPCSAAIAEKVRANAMSRSVTSPVLWLDSRTSTWG